jgi:hypothetical protein
VHFSPLTPGQEKPLAGKKLANISNTRKSQQPDLASDFFGRYLPWGRRVRIGRRVGKYFQRVGGAPLPVWFHAMPGSTAILVQWWR